MIKRGRLTLLLFLIFISVVVSIHAADDEITGGGEATRKSVDPSQERQITKEIKQSIQQEVAKPDGTMPAKEAPLGFTAEVKDGTAKIPSGSTVSVDKGDLHASLISNYDTDDLSTAEFVGMSNAVITKETVSAEYVNRFSSNSFSVSRIENMVYHRHTHVLEFNTGRRIKVKQPTPINIDKVGKSKVELGPGVVINITLTLPQQNTVWVFGNPLKSDTTTIGDEPFTDTDNDGLSDRVEYRLGTSPQLADSDNDGLSDRDEVLIYPTRETVANSFPDAGVSSDKEFVEWLEQHVDDLTGALHDSLVALGNQRDPFRDRDSDGVSDIVEHTNGLNISNDDTDNDGLSDAEEIVRARSAIVPQPQQPVGSGVACLDCVMQVEGDRGDQVSIDFSGYDGSKPGSRLGVGLGDWVSTNLTRPNGEYLVRINSKEAQKLVYFKK